jgi:Hypervirulence associated proteins TUDOR domain
VISEAAQLITHCCQQDIKDAVLELVNMTLHGFQQQALDPSSGCVATCGDPKKHTSEIKFKGYTVHASKEEPQYLIKSDKTEHLAMHKGSALRKMVKGKIRS